MSALRGVVGAAIGAGFAALALRVHGRARAAGIASADIVEHLPDLLADDARRVSEAARRAVQDGRSATARARSEFDEQVAAHRRRTQEHDA